MRGRRQRDADDVLSAAATADDLDGVGLDDGHLLGPVRAAVAVDGELAVRADLAGQAYRAGAGFQVLGAGCGGHARFGPVGESRGCGFASEALYGEGVFLFGLSLLAELAGQSHLIEQGP